ncbi:MAG TPA: hypothetical protein VNZ50_16230 [Hyphomicrobiaceae bacterium]|nr:hypothetical protein [Hyphomicrobiaceae bacterium]
MNWTEIEWGVGLLVLWAVMFVVLLKTVDRPGHPGIIRGQLVTEHFMLAHILLFIIAVSMLVKGSGFFE